MKKKWFLITERFFEEPKMVLLLNFCQKKKNAH